jgi:hypothetical protein
MKKWQKIWEQMVAKGARASARFNIHFRGTLGTPGPLAVWTLRRRELRAPIWNATVERSGNGAFDCNGGGQSGVALRLPPQSKFAAVISTITGLDQQHSHIDARQPIFKLT